MSLKIESLKVIISTFLTSIASLFGDTKNHMIVLIIFMIIDTIFGWVAGYKNKTWKSFTARWGVLGKIVELMLITCVYLINYIYSIEYLVKIVLYYFMLCEMASILENYASINKNLPDGLINIVKTASKNVVTKITQKLKILFGVDDEDNED